MYTPHKVSADMPANERSFAAEVRPDRPLRFVNTQASVLLDLVRGLAAAAVLLEHWRNIFFVDFGQVARGRWPVAVLYGLAGAGHQAVVIFFVMSGYLISASVFRMIEKDQWSWRRYGVHRLVRLWIVLVPGLLLTALWDRMGMRLARAPAITLYAGRSGDHMIGDVHATCGWFVGLGNLLFLQTLKVPVFGTDGALWSLANEFWYYVLFPLGVMALRPGLKGWQRFAHAAFFGAVAYFLRAGILWGFPIWLMGTLLVVTPVARLGRWWRWGAAAVYVPLLFGLGRSLHLGGLWVDYALAVATFGLIWVLLSARGEAAAEAPSTAAARTLARFSYTLYVGHTPLLVVLGALLLGPVRWQPDLFHLAVGVALLGLVMGYCLLLAMLTEYRTDRMRGVVEEALLGRTLLR